MSEIAMVGLGRMGGNMARRLARGGVEVALYNRTYKVAEEIAAETDGKGKACSSYEEVVASLAAPRVVWLMLPAGGPTDEAVAAFSELLSPGDVLVNGANAYYKESMAQAATAARKGIHYFDAGVSGGVWGLANGYCTMVGGDKAEFGKIERFIKILAPGADQGWMLCGPVGSGHYTKMVHNGIEYGMMQAIAEGLALVKSKEEFNVDIAELAEIWRYGSVVRSWLLDLTADFLKQNETLENIEPFVADSGEGRWTAIEAVEQGIPAPVMSLALMMRFSSQGHDDYVSRLLAMMRKGFGGHAVKAEQ